MATTRVWNFYEALGERSREALSIAEREVAAICDLRQEVNSGGFDSYFRYWGGNTAPTALEGLSSRLGPEWAGVLSDALRLFGEDYPLEPDSRADRMDELELEDALEELDRRFYDLEVSTDADTLLSKALGQ